jgi:hypothetical protein
VHARAQAQAHVLAVGYAFREEAPMLAERVSDRRPAERLEVADARLAGHVLHRGAGPAATHRNVRGTAADGRVLGVRCSSTGKPEAGAELEVLDARDWPALAALLAARAGRQLPPVPVPLR